MRYSLFVSYVTDDKHGVFSWALSNYKGIVASDQYIAPGNAKNDATRVCYIGLRKALRQVVKEHPLIQLTLLFDKGTQEAIAYELAGVESVTYPSLSESTKRVLNRFESHELAAFSDENDLRTEESSVMDDALDLLDEFSTFRGWWRLFLRRFTEPHKIIN